jgi:uncharacterized protein (TIGR02147 family)
MAAQAPNLFQYYDYRQFLRDFIDYKKRIDTKYSYRYFSNKAGFSSTNFISLVVKGKRNLSSDSIGKISKGIKFNKQERSFFENLVFMNQAASHEEKDHYYQKMLSSAPVSNLRMLGKSSYEYFSQWYNPVVRELVEIVPHPIDPQLIASLIIPSIKPSQVKASIELLKSLDLISMDENGRYKKNHAVVTTGNEVQSLQIANFHKAMIKLAAGAIDRFHAKDRDISGMVLSIDSKNIPVIKQKIADFKSDLSEFARGQRDEDQVIFIQILAFPFMKPFGEE